MGEIPRLSPSIADKVLQAPILGWSAHRLLGNHREKKKESQVEWQLWHAALLEGGAGIEVLDFDAFRSKDAKEARDRALHDGKIPIVRPKWEAMQGGVEAIKEQLHTHGINLDGVVEERIEWEQRATSGEAVACSGYIDHRNGMTIDDLKTGSGFTSKHMAGQLIAKGHSLLQDAAYRSAISAIHLEDLERVKMRYVFVMTQEPYVVTPVEMSGEYKEISRIRWQRAIDIWAACLANGTNRKHWPGAVEAGTIATVHPPGWMMSQEMEEEALRG